MTEVKFGFGENEECLLKVGIPCSQCIWEEACQSNDELINEDEGVDEL